METAGLRVSTRRRSVFRLLNLDSKRCNSSMAAPAISRHTGIPGERSVLINDLLDADIFTLQTDLRCISVTELSMWTVVWIQLCYMWSVWLYKYVVRFMLLFVCNCLCNTAQIFNSGVESVRDLTFCCLLLWVLCVSWCDWRCRRSVGMAPLINNFGTMEVTDQFHAPALYSREKKRGSCLSPSTLHKDLE